MFATIAGGYPREPLVAQPDRLGDADRRLAGGEITQAQHNAILVECVREVLREQELAGLAILADGGIRHVDRLASLVVGLGGTSSGEQAVLPDGDTVGVPQFERGIVWRAPILVEEWKEADGVTDYLVKQIVVGPYTIARLAAGTAGAHRTLALGLAEALNEELHALKEAGCPIVQIDEGAICAIEDDAAAWKLFADVQRRLTAGLDDQHLSLSLTGGAVHRAGYDAVLGGPWLSYLVDAYGGPDAWRFAFMVPADRGVIIGAADADLEARDDLELMVCAMAWAAEGGRGPDRVGLAPNGSLTAVGRHLARRKIEFIGEAIDLAMRGPLDEVAKALQPEPLQSRIEPLRRMAEAVATARSAAAGA